MPTAGSTPVTSENSLTGTFRLFKIMCRLYADSGAATDKNEDMAAVIEIATEATDELVAAMAGLIPQLNITGDPALAALAKEAATIALGEANAFRFDRELRSNATAQAQSIAARLANLFADD